MAFAGLLACELAMGAFMHENGGQQPMSLTFLDQKSSAVLINCLLAGATSSAVTSITSRILTGLWSIQRLTEGLSPGKVTSIIKLIDVPNFQRQAKQQLYG